jgi:cytidylate kinase
VSATAADRPDDIRGAQRPPRIAIDGPASSGKSSVGAAVAAALGFRFFDTGLIYRALARAALDREVVPSDGRSVAVLAPLLDLRPDAAGVLNLVLVDGEDVTARLRTADVDRAVSAVAAAPEVRSAVLAVQRAIAASGSIVLAGRDIGTVVLPDAEVKVWLDAAAETRAGRRARERGVDPDSAAGRAILADLRERDRVDSGREVSPSRPADDAVHVATDDLSFTETVSAVAAAIRARLGWPHAAPAASGTPDDRRGEDRR